MQIFIHQLNKVYRGDVHALNDLEMVIPSGMFGLLGAKWRRQNNIIAHPGGHSATNERDIACWRL